MESSSSTLRLRSRSSSRSSSRSRSRSCSRLKYKKVKYRLVDRKSEDVSLFWKLSVMGLLFIILLSSGLKSSSFKVIQDMFDTKELCFISTGLPTRFGLDNVCDFLILTPFVVCLVALFWIEMFCFCGRGGRTTKNDSLDKRPWRIVLPSLVCFIVMSLFEIYYNVTLWKYLEEFCEDLRQIRDLQLKCELLISLYTHTPMLALVSLRILIFCSAFTVALWFIVITIMVVRMVRGPDFEIVVVKPAKVSGAPSTVICENSSRERLIFLNREFPSTRSVRFR